MYPRSCNSDVPPSLESEHTEQQRKRREGEDQQQPLHVAVQRMRRERSQERVVSRERLHAAIQPGRAKRGSNEDPDHIRDDCPPGDARGQ